MQLDSMTAAEVDELVEAFAVLMRQQMRVACRMASDQITMSNEVVVADGIFSTALDALGVMTAQWKNAVAATLVPFLAKTFNKAGRQVASSLDVTPTMSDDETSSEYVLAVTFADGMVPVLTGFSDDLWQAASTSLAAGSQDGETVAQLAQRVEAVAKQKEKKAHVIAQTAVVGAVNAGEWQTLMAIAEKYSTITTKEWVATHDSHTRPTHWAADGQVVPLAAKFSVGQSLLDFPGDPFGDPEEIINCRCTTKYDAEILPANSTTQTSPDALSADSAVDTTEQITAAAATNPNWDAADHPRGKDGKFIKKGSNAFNALSESAPAYVTVSSASKLTQAEWDNYTPQQQHDIKATLTYFANDDEPGAKDALKHINKLSGEDEEDDIELEFDDDDEPDLFDPDTPIPGGVEPVGVTAQAFEAANKGFITHQQASDLADEVALGEITEDEAKAKLAGMLVTPPPVSSPSPSMTPSLTTGSPKPLKITHGFIHAKHETGATLARDQNGNEIVWNGTSYDIYDKNGDVVAQNIKKSKMYALLNDYYKDSDWHEPANEAVPVTHVAPLDAAPPPNPIPHPVSFPSSSSVDDALDDAFGPLTTGIAPASTVTTSPSTPAVAQGMDMSKWKQVGGQAGSNKGALFEAPDGKRYYVKSLKSKEHAQNEVLAAALYRAASINVPEVRHVSDGAPPGWSNVIASPIVPNAKSNKKGLTTPGKFQEQAQSTYAVTAWLANFDAVGLTHDNMIESDGQVHLIDVGGSMGYRAQGSKKKPGDWNEDPSGALSGLMDPITNPQAASVFGGMTYEQQRESAKALLGITDAQIDQMVKDAGLPPKQAAILKARRNAILAKYGLDGNNAATSNTPVATPAPVNTPLTPSVAAPPAKKAVAKKVVAKAIASEDIPQLAANAAPGTQLAKGVDDGGQAWSVSAGDVPGMFNITNPVGHTFVVDGPGVVSLSDDFDINWKTSVSATPAVSPTPSAPSATVPKPTMADLSPMQKAEFYKHFKAENVSPAWSGAKIYKSLQAAKLKMAGDPKIANMSDAELLKVLDQQHNLAKATSGTPYSTKTREWLKTPNGKKAINDYAAGGTLSSGPTNTAKTAAPSASVTPAPSLDDGEGADPNAALSAEIFSNFKVSAYGKYLKDSPEDIYWNAVQQAKAKGISVNQVLETIDAEGAKKLGVANAGLFKKKINDWHKTPAGQAKAKAIHDGTWSPAHAASVVAAKKISAKKTAKKVSPYGGGYGGSVSGGTTHPASTPLDEKVADISQTVPPFDESKSASDFPVITNTQAAAMWDEMIAESGQPFQPKQKASLKHYTTNTGFTNMNRYLRGEQGATDATQTHITNAQAGMRPTTRDIVLHRGQGSFTDGAGRHWGSYDEIKNYVGTNLHQQAFFSASVGGKADFGGSIKMEIEVPKGTPAAYVKAFSAYKNSESEMLLAANMEYRVMAVTKSGGQTVVRLRVVPKGSA